MRLKVVEFWKLVDCIDDQYDRYMELINLARLQKFFKKEFNVHLSYTSNFDYHLEFESEEDEVAFRMRFTI